MLRDSAVECDEGGSYSRGGEGVDQGARWMGVEAEPEHGDRCDRLHRRLKRIVKARGALDLQEAAALREAQQIQIWRRYGYASLVEYMGLEMGYTPRAAIERLRVANALPALPQIAAAIEQGDLSFSGARELTRVATPETEQKWLGATVEMNVREVEAAVSGHTRGDLPTDPPDPKLQRTILRLEIRPETLVRYREAKRWFEKQRGERVDDDAVMEEMCRMVLRGNERDRADTANHVVTGSLVHGSPVANANTPPSAASAVATATTAPAAAAVPSANTAPAAECAVATASTAPAAECAVASMDASTAAECHNASANRNGSPAAELSVPANSNAAMVLANAPPPYRVAVTICKQCKRGWTHGAGSVALMSPAAVERAQCDAQEIGDLDSPAIERAKQTIPESTRRKVKARDHGKCRVPGCAASDNIDIHHIVLRSRGGTNEMSNLITLCEAHHLALHDGAISITGNAMTGPLTIRREGRNEFARVTRAVDATKALIAEGHSRTAVRAAIDRTKTHVGRADLSLAQWIDIARRYLEQRT